MKPSSKHPHDSRADATFTFGTTGTSNVDVPLLHVARTSLECDRRRPATAQEPQIRTPLTGP